jgi:protein-disulfide isomerase
MMKMNKNIARTLLVAACLMLTWALPLRAIDGSALHPPAGQRMAIVVFEDLECPACGGTDPLLLQAERNYGIPLVRHDFVIPNHHWSKEAHIMARYFDTVSPQLGEEFRQYIFHNQASIYKTNLREWADRFANAHHTPLPAFYDPAGALRKKVEADTELGKSMGIHRTPTIYIVSVNPGTPYVEVPEAGKLFETIESVRSHLPPAAPISHARKGPKSN